MNLARIEEIAARLQSYAVIGAYALAAHGYVRNTSDFDLLTTDRAALTNEMWDRERADGMRVDLHRGDFDDPLEGAARIRSESLKLDVVVAKYKWQAAVIDRAELMSFGDVRLRVPRKSDLILLKLDAGGYLDTHDASALLDLGPREELLAELKELKPTLPERVQRQLADFLAQNSSSIG
jgi:hypothetical protein